MAGAARALARVTSADLEAMRKMLGCARASAGGAGKGGVYVYSGNEEEAIPYMRDWTGNFGPVRVHETREGGGHEIGGAVVRPGSSEEVATLLRYCNERGVGVVPQGGNTGLVGGSVPTNGGSGHEVVFSLGRLRNILSIDSTSGVAVVEAGCVLQNLEEEANRLGWTVPLDLGAKGSCTLGGNLSTNAGGIRLLRYGNLHGSVLGVESILADGTILDLLSTNRKDNTGFDLKQLFIGGEGLLGIVTKCSIQLAPKPSSVNVVWLSIRDYASALDVLRMARQKLGEVLSAFELVDKASLELVLARLPGAVSPPGGTNEQFSILIETSGSCDEHDKEKLERFIDAAFDQGLVADGAIAQNENQNKAFWHLREGITEALALRARDLHGRVFKYDLSIPVSNLYELVETVRERISGMDARVVGYGHMGDGNLHLNVVANAHDVDAVEQILEPFVYEWTAGLGGSVSAEHGIGQLKAKYIGLNKSKEALDLMAKMKSIMDPNGILNPHKVFPPFHGSRSAETQHS